MNLVPDNYWANAYRELVLDVAPPQDILRLWLENNIPVAKSATCFEFGCFPGRYLAVLGKMNYKLYGVDLAARVTTDLPLWLKQQGFQVGCFVQEDVFAFASQSEMTYDLVCSFGFMEHFADWQEILELHTGKVSKGGLLVVTVPNFAGLLQRSLHVLLDAENMKRHNIRAMCPDKWKDYLLSAGFSVQFHGSIGHFDFWIENPNANRFQIIGSALVKKMIPFLRCFPPCKIYSPFYGVIARKIS